MAKTTYLILIWGKFLNKFEFFYNNGYTILENIFSDSECEEIVKIANDLKTQEDYVPIMNIHNSSDKVLKFMSNKKILEFMKEKVLIVEELSVRVLLKKNFFRIDQLFFAIFVKND